jgi:hypothetical protein
MGNLAEAATEAEDRREKIFRDNEEARERVFDEAELRRAEEVAHRRNQIWADLEDRLRALPPVATVAVPHSDEESIQSVRISESTISAHTPPISPTIPVTPVVPGSPTSLPLMDSQLFCLFLKGLFNTILFMACIPNFLGVYQKYATRLTNLENHKHQSTYDYSLTIKQFALSAIVAYLGLTLSAFIYMPFGQQIMTYVHMQLSAQPGLSETAKAAKDAAASAGIWQHDIGNITTSINTMRLQNQMYTYTVTNQVIGTFLEIGLPYIMRFIGRVQGGAASGNGKAKGKRVDFQDESSGGAESTGTSNGGAGVVGQDQEGGRSGKGVRCL